MLSGNLGTDGTGPNFPAAQLGERPVCPQFSPSFPTVGRLSIQNRRVRSELQPRLEGDHAWTAIATQPDA